MQDIMSSRKKCTYQNEKLEARARLSVFDDFFFIIEGLVEKGIRTEVADNTANNGVAADKSKEVGEMEKNELMNSYNAGCNDNIGGHIFKTEHEHQQRNKKMKILQDDPNSEQTGSTDEIPTKSSDNTTNDLDTRNFILSRLREYPHVHIEARMEAMEHLSVFDDHLLMIPQSEFIDVRNLNAILENDKFELFPQERLKEVASNSLINTELNSISKPDSG